MHAVDPKAHERRYIHLCPIFARFLPAMAVVLDI